MSTLKHTPLSLHTKDEARDPRTPVVFSSYTEHSIGGMAGTGEDDDRDHNQMLVRTRVRAEACQECLAGLPQDPSNNSMGLCGRCFGSRYCYREHQRLHWEDAHEPHKETCCRTELAMETKQLLEAAHDTLDPNTEAAAKLLVCWFHTRLPGGTQAALRRRTEARGIRAERNTPTG